MHIAVIQRSRGGDPHCGDQAAYWKSEGKITLCMVDGLGHGLHAERAAHAAVDYVEGHLSESPTAIFAGCNVALRQTRGVAMGLAIVDEEAGELTYAGVGNTRALIAGAQTTRLPSDYGIVGGGYKQLAPTTVPLRPADLIILFTDGVDEQLDLSAYGKRLRADVGRLAQRIIAEWHRPEDDVAVLVFRREAS